MRHLQTPGLGAAALAAALTAVSLLGAPILRQSFTFDASVDGLAVATSSGIAGSGTLSCFAEAQNFVTFGSNVTGVADDILNPIPQRFDVQTAGPATPLAALPTLWAGGLGLHCTLRSCQAA